MPRSKVNPFESPVGTEELPPEPQEQTLAASPSTTVPTEFLTQLLAMFAAKMNEAIEAARKPPYDPIKEKQQARALESKHQAESAYWTGIQNRFQQCSHLREDMTCCICWATNSDGKYRGYCPHCQVCFSPVREECASQEIFDKYKELVRIPTSRGNAVHYVS